MAEGNLNLCNLWKSVDLLHDKLKSVLQKTVGLVVKLFCNIGLSNQLKSAAKRWQKVARRRREAPQRLVQAEIHSKP